MISLNQVVLKMATEIEQAKQTTDGEKIKQHARAIKLLADLILDDEQTKQPQVNESQPSISEQERQKMLGSNYLADDFGQSDSKSLLDF